MSVSYPGFHQFSSVKIPPDHREEPGTAGIASYIQHKVKYNTSASPQQEIGIQQNSECCQEQNKFYTVQGWKQHIGRWTSFYIVLFFDLFLSSEDSVKKRSRSAWQTGSYKMTHMINIKESAKKKYTRPG